MQFVGETRSGGEGQQPRMAWMGRECVEVRVKAWAWELELDALCDCLSHSEAPSLRLELAGP